MLFIIRFLLVLKVMLADLIRFTYPTCMHRPCYMKFWSNAYTHPFSHICQPPPYHECLLSYLPASIGNGDLS
jgi:hypothetical protein